MVGALISFSSQRQRPSAPAVVPLGLCLQPQIEELFGESSTEKSQLSRKDAKFLIMNNF